MKAIRVSEKELHRTAMCELLNSSLKNKDQSYQVLLHLKFQMR